MKARTTLEFATDIPRGFVMPAAVERAWWRLLADVEAAGERDKRIPCRGALADYWTSDESEEREYAAAMCPRCPVLNACSQFADVSDERWGTWAGIDRTELARAKGRSASITGPERHDVQRIRS